MSSYTTDIRSRDPRLQLLSLQSCYPGPVWYYISVLYIDVTHYTVCCMGYGIKIFKLEISGAHLDASKWLLHPDALPSSSL